MTQEKIKCPKCQSDKLQLYRSYLHDTFFVQCSECLTISNENFELKETKNTMCSDFIKSDNDE